MFVYFSNPLNKAKKSEWLEGIGKAIIPPGQVPFNYRVDVAARDGHIRTNKLRNTAIAKNYARTYLQEEAQHAKNAQIQKVSDSLANLRNGKNFTDIRYDEASRQHVGFPKVNGYMEIPLPNEVDLFDGTPATQYIQGKYFN